MERNLTQGSLLKNILYMSVPTMLGFAAQTLYDLVDMAWIGRISPEALAAVTILTGIFWLVEVLNEIIGTSSVSLISQNYGAKNYDRTRVCIEQTLTFKMFVSLIAMAILLIFMKPLIGFFTDDPLVQKDALDYGYLRIFFLPIMYTTYSIYTSLRCVGDSKTPMIIMFVSASLNIILDPIFIFEQIPVINLPGFGYGVMGAALATVISISVGFIFGLFALFSKKRRIRPRLKGLFRFDLTIDKKLMTIGLPTGIEVLFRNSANLIILKIITIYGTTAVAALGIGQRLSGFVIMPLIGLFMGSSTVVGQNLGAELKERAEKTTKYAAVLGAIFMLVISALTFIFAKNIMMIFTTDKLSSKRESQCSESSSRPTSSSVSPLDGDRVFLVPAITSLSLFLPSFPDGVSKSHSCF
ncbi:MAG: MATE family efflux transporter [Thermotogota bacterium]